MRLGAPWWIVWTLAACWLVSAVCWAMEVAR